MVELKTPRRAAGAMTSSLVRVAPAPRTWTSLAASSVLRSRRACALRPGIRTLPARRLRRLDPRGARGVGRRLLPTRGSHRAGSPRRSPPAHRHPARLHGEPACAHARARERPAPAGIFTDRPDLALRLRLESFFAELTRARSRAAPRRLSSRSAAWRPSRSTCRRSGRAGADDLQARHRPEERLRDHFA